MSHSREAISHKSREGAYFMTYEPTVMTTEQTSFSIEHTVPRSAPDTRVMLDLQDNVETRSITNDHGTKYFSASDIRKKMNDFSKHQVKASKRSVSAFLQKLYIMVDDPSIDTFVRWSKSGKSFLVERQQEFAKIVLPRFFKHNTFASFIRQLHMYHFHKIPHVLQGTADDEIWEFTAPYFRKGRPELLIHANRKNNRNNNNNEQPPASADLTNLVQDISIQQEQITKELASLRRAHEIMRQETREKHQRQEQAIFKILQFLNALFLNQAEKKPSCVPSYGDSYINRSSEAAHLPFQNNGLSSPKSISSPSYTLTSRETYTKPTDNTSMLDFSNMDSDKVMHGITQNMEHLEENVENLAYQLGIDPNQAATAPQTTIFGFNLWPPTLQTTTTTTTTIHKTQPDHSFYNQCHQQYLNAHSMQQDYQFYDSHYDVHNTMN